MMQGGTLRWQQVVVSGAVALCVLCSGGWAEARHLHSDESVAHATTVDKISRKLSAGVTNVLTCWAEVPQTVIEVSRDRNPVLGVLWGPVKGAVLGAGRFFAGWYDMLTFLIPVPKDFQPILEPAFSDYIPF